MHPTLVNSLPWSWVLSGVLAVAVQLLVGRVFYVTAWSGLRHGSANMSLLVALGTSAALVYSIISMVGCGGLRGCCDGGVWW